METVVANAFTVLDDAEFVASRSQHVGVDTVALACWCDNLEPALLAEADKGRAAPFFDGSYRTLHYLLLLYALDFCLWPCNRAVWHSGSWLKGHAALAAALRSAFEEGVPLWSARVMTRTTAWDLTHALSAIGDAPLQDVRVAFLNQAGRKLLGQYEGNFKWVIQAAGSSAPQLAALLAREFNAFEDAAEYAGRPVRLLSRAQALVVRLHQVFGSTRWGQLDHLDQLTASSGPLLPQALRAIGALRYSPSLAQKVDRLIPLIAGCNEETEIRSCAVVAVHLGRRRLQSRGMHPTAAQLESALRETLARTPGAAPPHRAITTAY